MRLADKVAIVVGAGQTPGETIGNGRATALLFAREGARVIAVDRREDSARQTCAMIEEQGGTGVPVQADATSEQDCRRVVDVTVQRFGRVDVLHNNVGVGGGDGGPVSIREEAWDRILSINLKSVLFPCKTVLPVMREQHSGAIVNISSAAAVCATGMMAYKTSKAGVNALTQAMAAGNAKHGIRANVIMPGLMHTPMAVDAPAKARGVEPGEYAKQRDALVPLGHMGSAWDVAYAALFLASDEAKFITGAILPVDGGQSAMVG